MMSLSKSGNIPARVLVRCQNTVFMVLTGVENLTLRHYHVPPSEFVALLLLRRLPDEQQHLLH